LDPDENLKLALPMLRMMGELSQKLADKTDIMDKRYDHLVHIQTSAGVLVRHIERFDKLDDIKPLEPRINQVADCLEGMLNERVVERHEIGVSDSISSGAQLLMM
jgi:hypothetical protein